MNILKLWDITVEELSQALFDNGSLRGIVFGYVAEIKLRKLIMSNEHVTRFTKDDDHDRSRKGDLRIQYKGREFRIESKSLQTARNQRLPEGTFTGVAQVDASDRRTVTLPDGTQIQTTNLLVGEFDILAVNCFSFLNEWHFVFARNEDLPRTVYKNYTETQRQHLLATTVRVSWPPTGIFIGDIFKLMDQMVGESKRAATQQRLIIQEEGKPPDVVEE